MSDYVHFKGEIEPIQKEENETIEELCKRVLASQHRITYLPTYYHNYEEYLLDYFYQEYVVVNDTLYKVNVSNVGLYDDIYEARKLENGNLAVELKYYNGGTNLSEAINKAMEKL